MAQTFNDINGKTCPVDCVVEVKTNTDILTKEITGYFAVFDNDNETEISSEVYYALKENL